MITDKTPEIIFAQWSGSLHLQNHLQDPQAETRAGQICSHISVLLGFSAHPVCPGSWECPEHPGVFWNSCAQALAPSATRLFCKNWSFILCSHKRAQLTEPADIPSAAIHSAGAVCLSGLFVALSQAGTSYDCSFLQGLFRRGWWIFTAIYMDPAAGDLHSTRDKAVLHGSTFLRAQLLCFYHWRTGGVSICLFALWFFVIKLGNPELVFHQIGIISRFQLKFITRDSIC